MKITKIEWINWLGTWWDNSGIQLVDINWIQYAWLDIFEYISNWVNSIWAITISLEVSNEWADFIIGSYVNWIDINKDITITDWWGTIVNGKYLSSLFLNESLVNNDVFTLKIKQVWSQVKWANLLVVINIS